MEPFEVHGTWWLPEHEGHRVPGVLSWDHARGGTLRLVGQLRPIILLEHVLTGGQAQRVRDRGRDSDRSYPVVLGQSEDIAYTLLQCFQSFKRDWSLEQSTETVHVNALLQGAFFDEPLKVDRARFWLRDLAEWVDTSGLKVTHPQLDGTGEDFTLVSAARLPDIAIPCEGPHVTLAHQLADSVRGNRLRGIEQDWVLHVEVPEVAPLTTFVDVASDLQDLISIATGRTSAFHRVVLYHPDLPQRSLAGNPLGSLRQPLDYHAQWSNRVDHESQGLRSRDPVSPFEMYFTFEHIGALGVGRWLDTAAEFRTELGRAMATRYSRSYLEDRIMNICAALESFDKHRRTTTGQVWYVNRIAACVDLAGDPFRNLIVEDQDEWSMRVRDVRNDLAHHTDKFRHDGSVGGYILAEQLFWLFTVSMLRIAQAPEAVFDSIVKHRRWTWLRAQAQEYLLQ